MAKKRAAPKPRTTRTKGTVEVTVPVPEGTKKITVTDLKSLSKEEIAEHLKKAQRAKVGFTILNAPFKVRPVDPVS
jgi:beta-lactam-binding protein with PASTA domain